MGQCMRKDLEFLILLPEAFLDRPAFGQVTRDFGKAGEISALRTRQPSSS